MFGCCTVHYRYCAQAALIATCVRARDTRLNNLVPRAFFEDKVGAQSPQCLLYLENCCDEPMVFYVPLVFFHAHRANETSNHVGSSNVEDK